MDAVCTTLVGSARAGRVLDAGAEREDRPSDVCYVGDTRQSFSEKDDDNILHIIISAESCPIAACNVFGICDCLGKVNEIDLESRRNTDSVVLTPRVSENVTQSRLYAADNFSSCAPIAEGNLFARASSFENTWLADSERSTAEGTFRLSPKPRTRKAVVERANENADEERYRLCKIADCAETLKFGHFPHTRPARNSAGLVSIPCGEAGKR